MPGIPCPPVLRDRVSQSLLEAVRRLSGRGAVTESGWPMPEVEAPKQADHGDLATNWALTAAKAAGTNPRALAEALVAELDGDPLVARAEVAGPGFVNLVLSEAALVEARSEAARPTEGLLADPGHFGRPPAPAEPHGFNVEFVSVNPNGPITIGSGRGAAYGSTLCNVLEASGHGVHREYYINDGVNSEQMRQFASSIRSYLLLRIYGEYIDSTTTDFTDPNLVALIEDFAQVQGGRFQGSDSSDRLVYDAFLEHAKSRHSDPRLHELAEIVRKNAQTDYYQEERPGQLGRYIRETWKKGGYTSPLPARYTLHYRGDYVFAVVQRLVETALGADRLLQWQDAVWNDEELTTLQAHCQKLMLDAQRSDLEAFGVTFDTWFSEQSLHDSGVVAEWIDHLVESGVADERPQRTKVKFAKGGVMEEVTVEPQAGDEEDDSQTTGGQPTLWLRSTLFGDDMDRVLRRRDGRLTYIASDVAYHADKFNRGSKPDAKDTVRPADRLITVLGPDHHGYIGRLHAVVAADLMAQGTATPLANQAVQALTEAEAALYGTTERRDACQAALAASRERLTVQIFQLVRFLKDGKPAPMRKRDGNIYAIIDLIREIGQKVRPEAPEAEQLAAGKDVARFFYLMRHHDTTFDFDLDLAEKQSDENPVFYVQYAHARICGVLRTAAEAGIGPSIEAPGQLHPKERALLLKVADLPNEVRRCAEDFGVNRLATYAIELARAYHHFYDACRVVDPADPATSASRVQTCLAAQSGLRGALELLGVSAPERM
jgi:arginyl-tRNA synthetase